MSLNLTKLQRIIVAIIGVLVLFFVLIFIGVIPGLQTKSNPQNIAATLKVWGLYDPESSYSDLFQNFKTLYPKVTITYKSFSDLPTYESALLDALAAGSGPDIFMVGNTDLQNELNKISPFPATKLTLKNVGDLFPQVVQNDFVYQGAAYALPASIDTLGLYYNKDLFDQAAIVPPVTWTDFLKDVPRLVQLDSARNIHRAAAAIGGSQKTIPRASDILLMLMLQAGTPMTSADGRSAQIFTQEGIQAVNFYTQFANAVSDSYTWNDTLPNAMDSFANGTTAMMFDYASALQDIKAKNAFLNLGVIPVPQAENTSKPAAFARYFGYAVSKQSKNKTIAWDLILQLATNPDQQKAYLKNLQKPPALRSLIQLSLNDTFLSTFARQALIARSWKEVDPDAIQSIFSTLIDAVITNSANVRSALQSAQSQITERITKKYFSQ